MEALLSKHKTAKEIQKLLVDVYTTERFRWCKMAFFLLCIRATCISLVTV